jgi:hypothetical protein
MILIPLGWTDVQQNMSSPTGLEFSFWFRFYKYVAPLAVRAGLATEGKDPPAGNNLGRRPDDPSADGMASAVVETMA